MSKCLVICAQRYNGHELWTLLGVLQKRSHTFEVVSTQKLIRDELSLQPNTIERLVYDVKPTEIDGFDAIIVVSGNMSDTEAYWKDTHIEELLKAFQAKDLVTAAICCSVPTLAPIARGHHVSFFPLVRSRKRLEAGGAILEPVSLTVDRKMVTAENQMITTMWAMEICNLLEGKPPEFVLKKSGFVPSGKPRRLPVEIQEAIDVAKKNRGNQNFPS